MSSSSFNAQMNSYWKKNLFFRGRASERYCLDVGLPYEKIAEEVNRIRPDILYCFGSYSEHLVKYIENRKLPFNPPKIWFYGSDMMSWGTREFIEARFGSLVYSAYNMNEMGAMSFECERRDGYHLNIDACFIRIADEEGNTLPTGEQGEVIVSNLVNTATILLNYRTGDRGRLTAEPCSCGRTLPLLRDFSGRVTDTIHLAENISISFRQLDARAGKLMNDVALYQIVQDRPGHVCWSLVPLPGCRKDDVEGGLRQLMREAAPLADTVEIKWVPQVELTPGQKRKFVVHRFQH